ncbi:MAG: hypothetical protein A3I11_07100 [Elusimicrobia bacterium RIFCSPLOWO2_02_FULL_39_32]|nr:MAG: hypothetical protein A2034_01355 [Elusimicrobia bacterium GWA2_38_7]OGR81476.1 MAG: hypothetical protein A3B80_05525 [Elusimicrobia bacterium RIFCSPHIGHO2_02_FULL_39_36]OGR91955.1 MAG: hypothetical protein A3I11_07100 [Elusimicrobia bacterium RIFCSPLOWO2_02_FULL_39_32]OGR98752.1 MAG: hypothetical protein A3G85_05330 [Elusimicrobia bacterium RIFCSPLOWO2_12_FULL_39_28]
MKLLFFAQAADWVGTKKLEIHLENPLSLEEFIKKVPELAPILKHKKIIKVSKNQEFINFQTEIQDSDEIAFLPPVSGG